MNYKAIQFSQSRDRFSLGRKELLADYANISARRPGAVEATAIRTRSLVYLDVLSIQLTNGRLDWSELKEACSKGIAEAGISGFRSALSGIIRYKKNDAEIIAQIARILLLVGEGEESRFYGEHFLRVAVDLLPKNIKSRSYRLMLTQIAILKGDLELAEENLASWKDIREMENGFIGVDLLNPYSSFSHGAGTVEREEWLQKFNLVFSQKGLTPVALFGDETKMPFDRLTTNNNPISATENGGRKPLISVVLTTFEPSLDELLTSVNSILNQTIRDLELIVIDDASGHEYNDVFDELSGLDERIRIIRLSENIGTYAARNVGIEAALGEYFTGQDDDDWSHPQRLERQMKYLQENPEAAGCRVQAMLCAPDLTRIRLGYKSTNKNASSLMVKTSLARNLGGFIPIRKAADTEFMQRIQKYSGKKIAEINDVLTIVRILPNSLSRTEFAPGWSHPARNQFKSAYGVWHQAAKLEELELDGSAIPVAAPRRFQNSKDLGDGHYSVILAGDWRKFGGPQKSMVEEIHALKEAGLSVAILHLEAGRFMTRAVEPLATEIQVLLNKKYVDQVLFDDEVSCDLMILRYPPILQFMADTPTSISIGKMFITANQAPSEMDGSDIRYRVPDCHEKASRVFKENVTWVPQGPQVRNAIQPYLSDEELEDFDFPGILNIGTWSTAIPRAKRSTTPVIGRHSRDDSMKWPETKEMLETVYPTQGSVSVRVMGGGKTPLRVLNRKKSPTNWEILQKDQLDVREFLDSLDFFVFYQHSNSIEAFGRAILEAIAANLVVILPHRYQPVFGDAAVYARPHEVSAIVKRFYNNWELYEAQQRRADKVLRERFNYESFVGRIKALLAEISEGEF